jgi:methionyl-tRNA formyltransferase
LIGQKAFGADALSALAKDGVELAGAVVGTSDAGREDPVEEAAGRLSIDCLKTGSLKNQDVMAWVSERKPDLIVMAFVTLYMPMSLAGAAPAGTINFHPSLLPLHRGISAIPWTILHGDERAGLSIHFVDEGIDTGDVVVQKEVDVADDDDFKTLYFKKIYPLGISAICEAVGLIASGNPPRIKQDESKATYEPPLKKEHLTLDWSGPMEMNHRKIRAGNPGFGGVTWLEDGREASVYGCKKIGGPCPKDAEGGRIVRIDEGGIAVQCQDGTLLLTSLRLSRGEKLGGSDFASAYDLSPGNRFINSPPEKDA